MSVLKDNDLKIENFTLPKFTQGSKYGEVQDFKFGELNPDELQEIDEAMIRIERTSAEGSGFEFDQHVKEHRGIKQQEREDLEKRVDELVAQKYEALSESAYTEGIALGKEEGKKEALELTLAELEEKVNGLQSMLANLEAQRVDILTQQKSEAAGLIKNVAKWVALKEIKSDESCYVEKLLEKLVREVHTKSNLVLKVSPSVAEQMPHILPKVEEKIGQLENVKVEVNENIETGMILESKNGIVDATLDSQFAMIDKIFSSEV